jgi:hypothetical protein
MEASQGKTIGWLYAEAALGYLLLLAYTLYATNPFRIGLANNPPEYFVMLVIFCVPLVVSAGSALVLLRARAPSTRTNWLVVATSVLASAVLLFRGFGLFLVLLVPPTLLLAVRNFRVRA